MQHPTAPGKTLEFKINPEEITPAPLTRLPASTSLIYDIRNRYCPWIPFHTGGPSSRTSKDRARDVAFAVARTSLLVNPDRIAYHRYPEFVSEVKTYISSKVVAELDPDLKGDALVLDGRALQSSAALRPSASIVKIHVTEINTGTALQQQQLVNRKRWDDVIIHPVAFNAFIDILPPVAIFPIIHLDGMATWNGNSSFRPRDDVKAVVQKGLLLPGGLLSLTFCPRERVRDDVTGIDRIQQVAEEITSYAISCGYDVEMVDNLWYSNPADASATKHATMAWLLLRFLSQ